MNREKVIVMSETEQRAGYPANPPYPKVTNDAAPTVWAGFVMFGGILMLMVMGGFQFIEGLVALFKEDYYFVSRNSLMVTMDFATWGWTHMVIGLAAVTAGLGVLAGQMWARVLGIGTAVIGAFANIAFLAAYPGWSTILIVTDVLAIYALVVHGRVGR
jgi:hypothetical protein